MNIFVLDTNPELCAKYHCDKHLVKMITEHNQILGSIAYTARGVNRKAEITPGFVKTVFQDFPRRNGNDSHPYGIGYKNHPCTQWARASYVNYKWLCDLTLEMCKEYTRRYGRKHAGEAICQWYYDNAPNLAKTSMTPFAQAMPDDCKDPNAVTAYRNYYKKHKARFAKWAHSETPSWFNV
jgi:Pyrimidine dimer DNA glycosylase